MKEFFKDILDIDEVKGVFFFHTNGEQGFHEVDVAWRPKLNGKNPGALFDGAEGWEDFQKTFADVLEAEMVFEDIRIYFRWIETGIIFILLERYATAAMARLNLDIAVPALNKIKRAKGLGRLFKRR